jgi:hypothetical protein
MGSAYFSRIRGEWPIRWRPKKIFNIKDLQPLKTFDHPSTALSAGSGTEGHGGEIEIEIV